MTVYFAQSSSNINAANVWNTAANGSGTYLTWPPASGDVLMANGKTITVNVDCNLGTNGAVRTDAANGATTGGLYDLSTGVTLTANLYAGTGACAVFAKTGNAYINGNLIGGSNYYCYGAYNSGSGILNINGNVTAGSSLVYAHGVANEGPGTINITGNVTAADSASHGCSNRQAGIINITGNVTGGSSISGVGLSNVGVGSVYITGNVTGGISAYAYGVYNEGTGSVVINGSAIGGTGVDAYGAYNQGTGVINAAIAVGNNYGIGSTGISGVPGIRGSQTGFAAVKALKFGPRGQSPVMGNVFITPDASNQNILIKTNFDEFAMIPADSVIGQVAATDVRHGVSYALGNLTGSCHVPAANQVSAGVAVDNTVGTAVLTAAAIRAELATELGRIDASISSRATAVGVRTELAPELATIEAINDRIELQVPDGPVVVIPAPSTGQTTAWAACYDEHGAPEAGVIITVKLYAAVDTTGAAFDAASITATSNAEGVASLAIPRNAGLRFQVRRGSGPWVKFSGVDAASLELPAIIG